MNFEVLTLFPGMMNSIFGESIIGRAIDNTRGNILLSFINAWFPRRLIPGADWYLL